MEKKYQLDEAKGHSWKFSRQLKVQRQRRNMRAGFFAALAVGLASSAPTPFLTEDMLRMTMPADKAAALPVPTKVCVRGVGGGGVVGKSKSPKLPPSASRCDLVN